MVLLLHLFVRLLFLYGVCTAMFFISPCFGALGGLCVVIVAFPGYLHLYFNVI